MKRSYAQTLRASSVLNACHPDTVPTDADVRLARTEALLREANRNRLADHQKEQLRKEAILTKAAAEHAAKSGAGHSIHYTLAKHGHNGDVSFETVVVKEITPELAGLMANPQPLLTGLIWEGLTLPERTSMLKELGLETGLIFQESVLPVLPEESKQYVLAWQKQINSGAAWSGSLSVGERADGMIEQGFLLHGKETVATQFVEVKGRSKLEGAPGSTSFVRAMMGRLYLEWLLEHEEHPIEA